MKKLQEKVLVLNKAWQAIDTTTAMQALCDCFRGSATAIADDGGSLLAMPWSEWAKLPVREEDQSIKVPNGIIRMPDVIVKASYTQMPKRRPKFNRKGVGVRDRQVCGYTGQYRPDGNMDHVIPRSKGGPNTWTNVVWSAPEVNSRRRIALPGKLG